MDKVLVFLDAGFLSKVSYYLGDRDYFKYDLIKFAKRITGKEELIFKKLFYYNAPPYQSQSPTPEQKRRKENYDNFIRKIKNIGGEEIIIKEGRLQRLKAENGEFEYRQKGVDTHLVMDLMSIPIEYPKIKKIILIACDSDFVPIVTKLKSFGIEIILYTYFERKRDSLFSTSNFLLQSVSKWEQITKEDFHNCQLF